MTAKELLLSLGVTPDLKGFKYSIEMIELIRKDKDATQICVAYKKTGKKYGVTSQNVERCIRRIVVMLFKNNQDITNFFCCPCINSSGKYTNSQFLSLCAMYLDDVNKKG